MLPISRAQEYVRSADGSLGRWRVRGYVPHMESMFQNTERSRRSRGVHVERRRVERREGARRAASHVSAAGSGRRLRDRARARPPKSTTHRLLAALGRRALVERDPGGRYRPGARLLALGLGVLEREPVVAAARPVLEAEAEALGETLFLAAARAGRIVVLDKAEGTGLLRAAPRVGSEVPVHATAIGKLYLAFAPERCRCRRDRSRASRARTQTSRRALAREVATRAAQRIRGEPRGVDGGARRGRGARPRRRAHARERSGSRRRRCGSRPRRPQRVARRLVAAAARIRATLEGRMRHEGLDRRTHRGRRRSARLGARPRAPLRRRHLRGHPRLRARRVPARRPPRAARHARRRRSASCCRDPVAAIRDVVLDTLRALGRDDAYVRLVVTRGEGALGVDPTTCPAPRLFCIAAEAQIYPLEKLAQRSRSGDGERAAAGARRARSAREEPQLPEQRAGQAGGARARRRRGAAAERRRHDRRGERRERVRARAAGALATPPPTDGALEGITRRTVLEIAASLGLAPTSDRSRASTCSAPTRSS